MRHLSVQDGGTIHGLDFFNLLRRSFTSIEQSTIVTLSDVSPSLQELLARIALICILSGSNTIVRYR